MKLNQAITILQETHVGSYGLTGNSQTITIFEKTLASTILHETQSGNNNFSGNKVRQLQSFGE